MSPITELLVAALSVLLLLAGSAFFSAAETALTAASRARMHALEQDGNPRAGLVNRLIGDRDRLIGALLLGNTIVITLASALATEFLVGEFGSSGVVYATLGMSVLLVLFGEVLPKTYAFGNADQVSLFLAAPVRFVVGFLSPVNLTVVWLVRRILTSLGVKVMAPATEEAAHEELRGAIDLHHKEGAVVKGDRDMIGGILDLGDLTVSDIMVHRTEMETVCADDPAEKLIAEALKTEYTRIPAWSGEVDNIVGFLHVKDLLRELAAQGWERSKVDTRKLLIKPWFVPDSTSLKDQLAAFQQAKGHIAMVVDEYGEVMGLVTLEDIIEEIVGQIADEHDDSADAGIRPQPDGRVVVDGTVAVRDLNRSLEWNLPDEEATTIAGLVIHEAQTIPEPGQVFTFYGYRFEVVKKVKNRITLLRVTPLVAKAAAGDSTGGTAG
jgi:Mg2+/Co2+ transporter CorB